MTNQEAIKTLELLKFKIAWEYPLYYQIALDMAIRILEQGRDDGK